MVSFIILQFAWNLIHFIWAAHQIVTSIKVKTVVIRRWLLSG
jgi:hypothetical protein